MHVAPCSVLFCDKGKQERRDRERINAKFVRLERDYEVAMEEKDAALKQVRYRRFRFVTLPRGLFSFAYVTQKRF